MTGIPYICQCQLDPKERNPCPPFGNAVNPFLRDLLELAKEHGAATVKEALAKLRVELGCEG